MPSRQSEIAPIVDGEKVLPLSDALLPALTHSPIDIEDISRVEERVAAGQLVAEALTIFERGYLDSKNPAHRANQERDMDIVHTSMDGLVSGEEGVVKRLAEKHGISRVRTEQIFGRFKAVLGSVIADSEATAAELVGESQPVLSFANGSDSLAVDVARSSRALKHGYRLYMKGGKNSLHPPLPKYSSRRRSF